MHPARSNLPTDRIINYGDRWSYIALWWKAIFLFPPWVYLCLALIGGVAFHFGMFVYQVAYILLLAAGLSYLIEDLLMRKIRIDENNLYFGYSTYRLANLASVGLNYSSNRVIPKSLLLYFGAGKRLELNLSRMNYEEIQMLLTLIENKVPHCHIDPVITTLIKSKKLARKVSMEEADRTEIVYHSRRAIKEVWQAFMTTSNSWTRLGPILLFLFAAPAWLSASRTIYSMPITDYTQRAVPLHDALVRTLAELDGYLTQGVSTIGGTLWWVVSNPFVAAALTVPLLCFAYYFIQLALKPNRLVLDARGVKKNFATMSASLPLAAVQWDEVVSAKLVKPKKTAGPEQWSIALQRKQRSPFKIELGAVTPDDRSRLSRAIERWAPHCEIESELVETLMPRQANSYTELWLQSLAAPPERASLEPLSAGRVLQEGTYEVVKRLGVGGQGAAYMCKQHIDSIPPQTAYVVLKETIIPVFVEPTIRKQALERFEQEARILKSLNSDFVVKLIDYFVEDHRGYLVLELIDGKSLRQMVEDRGPLSKEQVLDMCQQMCDILGYLHSSNVIHRDFTPDNLILGKDGKLKLIDFNVAQQEDEGSSGVVVGKHAYLPPEQFRGRPTTQSDIYAMGATLYFLSSGNDPEPITQSSLQGVVADFSPQMEEIIQSCTTLDCGKRAKHVADLQAKLSGASGETKPECAGIIDTKGSTITLSQADHIEAIKVEG